MVNPKIAKNFRMLLKKNGLTLEALSRTTGISTSMLGDIQRGATNPSVINLTKLAKAFNVTEGQLLGSEKIEIETIDDVAVGFEKKGDVNHIKGLRQLIEDVANEIIDKRQKDGKTS